MKKKRLFYDIETSLCEGVFFRPGYNQTITPNQILRHAQIVCISWKWEGRRRVHNIHWGLDEQNDKALVAEFISILNEADEIVAHNGDRFDIKWIRARAAFHGIPMRHTYKMIDTYKLAKKYFALPGYRLADVADYFGLEAKRDPGGLQTWIDVINKDRSALKRMLWYCDGDIITLEAVYKHIRRYTEAKFNYAVANGVQKFCCPECGNLGKWNKTYTTVAGTVKVLMLCRDSSCATYYKVNKNTYEEYLQYKLVNDIN